MFAFSKEFYMLVMFFQIAFLESQELATSLPQSKDGGVHLLKHIRSFFLCF